MQYLHVDFGTLTDLYVNVYDSSGAVVGSQTRLYSSTIYTSRTVTVGQEYYIRVTPYSSSYSGTYKIAFNTSTTPPPVTIPSSFTTLTADSWADGILSTNGEQWFKFTATADTQYLHADFGTLSASYGMNINVYNSSGTAVESQTRLYSGTKYTSRPVTIGQEYYIRVVQYNSSYSGTYKIAFNTAFVPPDVAVATLTAATWTAGTLSTNGVQWFKFTATAATQYLHVDFGTLTSLYVDVYDTGGTAVGSQANLTGSTRYTSRSVTSGQAYYIRITPYSSSYSGNYRIAFNTSTTAPP
jgi:predicted RNA-binding protein with TRAM domain